MRRLLVIMPYMLVMLITFGIAFWLAQVRPDLRNNVVLAIDIFSISELATQEKQRVSTIKLLKISSEQKEALVNKTVFIGCTKEMVQLALGAPRSLEHDEKSRDIWVYYLGDEKRATKFAFDAEGKLVEAFKASAVELSVQQPN